MDSVLQTLGINSEIYDRRFEVFLQKSRLNAVVFEWLNQNIPEILTHIKDSRVGAQVFNVLSVGCSAGDKDMVILKHLEELLKNEEKVHYTALDPSSLALKQFEERVKQSFKRVTFIKNEMTFQELCSAPCTERSTFDLVLFISSLYYCNAEEALVHCFNNELKESGAILCVVQNKESPLRMFHNKFHGSNLSDQNESYIMYTTDDLAKIAEKNGWSYKLFKYKYDVDVTECFDEKSGDGNLLLDFLVHLHDVRKNVSNELCKKIIEELKQHVVEDSDGKKTLVTVGGVILICKNV